MIEHKQLHEWVSWREEWTYADVEQALATAGLVGWTIDHWSDGDIQFMHQGPVAFDDLARLRVAFAPRRMIVEAVVDSDKEEELDRAWKKAGSHPLHRPSIPTMILVTMSWNVESDPEAV